MNTLRTEALPPDYDETALKLFDFFQLSNLAITLAYRKLFGWKKEETKEFTGLTWGKINKAYKIAEENGWTDPPPFE